MKRNWTAKLLGLFTKPEDFNNYVLTDKLYIKHNIFISPVYYWRKINESS